MSIFLVNSLQSDLVVDIHDVVLYDQINTRFTVEIGSSSVIHSNLSLTVSE